MILPLQWFNTYHSPTYQSRVQLDISVGETNFSACGDDESTIYKRPKRLARLYDNRLFVSV